MTNRFMVDLQIGSIGEGFLFRIIQKRGGVSESFPKKLKLLHRAIRGLLMGAIPDSQFGVRPSVTRRDFF
jgi:hypothetical protein